MKTKNKTKRSVLTLGAVVGLSLAASTSVMANPFQSNSLRDSSLLAANTNTETKAKDMKCGQGKCGAKGMTESKSKDAKCGANCTESKSKDGKCGANCTESKAKDGKCGQGTCGGKKK